MIARAIVSLLVATAPVHTPRLVLVRHAPLEPSASLLHEQQPSGFEMVSHELGRSPEKQMALAANDLFQLPACSGRHGTCDNTGDLALLAGIVGFFIGFGIGHLITGNVTGFVIWLLIDLVVIGVFFIALPATSFSEWWVISIIALAVDRVLEAFSAAASATRDHVALDALPPERDVLTGAPSAPQIARVFTWHF